MNRKTEDIDPVPKQFWLKLAEVSILLDSYDDIFSDFDPSEYSERALSDDFCIQAKKHSRNEIGNKMTLRVLLKTCFMNRDRSFCRRRGKSKMHSLSYGTEI